METIIRRIDDDNGERYYEGVEQTEDGGEKRIWCFPSVTHKLDAAYPKDPFLLDWIRKNGNEGEDKFKQAGDDGTSVHVAIDTLLHGEKVSTENMNTKVKKCVQSFIDWYTEFKPEILNTETMVANTKYKYAGCLDLRCKLNYKKGKTKYKGVFVIDYKTSKSVHDIHKAQTVAYQKAFDTKAKVAILHLGNRTNAGYSFLEFRVAPYWAQFKNASKMFDLMNPTAQPTVTTYPEFFIL